ncbi:TPA: zinc ribbon domain-containing protein [Yersinia enterocolitica]|nr:zinc ribbon domain-containing protein [Yersinia enterocolitica]
MYCMKCGASVDPNDKFCSSCGTQVNQLNQTKTSAPWLNDSSKRQQTIIDVKPTASTKNDFMDSIKKWGTRAIILIVATVFAVLGKDIGRVLTDKSNNASIWENAAPAFAEEKIKLGIPKRLDDNTVITDMFIQDKSINYIYKINDMTPDDETLVHAKAIAKESFTHALCDNILIAKYQGSANYIYQFPTKTLTATFNKSDCPPR